MPCGLGATSGPRAPMAFFVCKADIGASGVGSSEDNFVATIGREICPPGPARCRTGHIDNGEDVKGSMKSKLPHWLRGLRGSSDGARFLPRNVFVLPSFRKLTCRIPCTVARPSRPPTPLLLESVRVPENGNECFQLNGVDVQGRNCSAGRPSLSELCPSEADESGNAVDMTPRISAEEMGDSASNCELQPL